MSDIRPTDDHPEGGRYIDERGYFINAKGEYIDERGTVVERPVKAGEKKAKPSSRLDGAAMVVEQHGIDLGTRLAAAGFDTPDKVQTATDDQLLAVEGITPATLKKIRA